MIRPARAVVVNPKHPLLTLMNIKEFVNEVDLSDPDWSKIPEWFPDCDLENLESDEIGKYNATKSMWEVSEQTGDTARSHTHLG